MNDLEWYLDIGGKQSGPHAAKEIVDLVRSGKIPMNAQVTAARMSGDWVTAKDLVEAYDELYAKSVAKNINDQFAPFTAGSGTKAESNQAIPPRPTEQLEKSKIIYLNPEPTERAPDPTDALFQAIQAVREKSQQKSASPSLSATGAPGRESHGHGSKKRSSGLPPQMILILTLAAVFGITVYGISILVGGKKSETIDAKKAAPATAEAPRHIPPNSGGSRTGMGGGNGLLNSGGGGQSAAQPAPRYNSGKPDPRFPNREVAPSFPTRLEKGGGARYRDEMDSVTPDAGGYEGADVEEGESAAEGHEEEGVDPSQSPVDPAQVLTDPYSPDSPPPGRALPVEPGRPPYQENVPLQGQ